MKRLFNRLYTVSGKILYYMLTRDALKQSIDQNLSRKEAPATNCFYCKRLTVGESEYACFGEGKKGQQFQRSFFKPTHP